MGFIITSAIYGWTIGDLYFLLMQHISDEMLFDIYMFAPLSSYRVFR